MVALSPVPEADLQAAAHLAEPQLLRGDACAEAQQVDVAGFAAQCVGTVENIVAGSAVEHVVAHAAADRVVVGRAAAQFGEDASQVPGGAIGEGDLLDRLYGLVGSSLRKNNCTRTWSVVSAMLSSRSSPVREMITSEGATPSLKSTVLARSALVSQV